MSVLGGSSNIRIFAQVLLLTFHYDLQVASEQWTIRIRDLTTNLGLFLVDY